MAELLCSKYIPVETVVVKPKGKTKADYLKQGCEVKELCCGMYLLTKAPKLEMFFREGERDFVFDMIDEARKYFSRLCIGNEISDTTVHAFVLLIANGKIKVTIFPDGTYVLE